MAKRVGTQVDAIMVKNEIGKFCNFQSIYRTDFGMIRYGNHSNDKTEPAFDQKCREHVHSVELVYQSKQRNAEYGFY